MRPEVLSKQLSSVVQGVAPRLDVIVNGSTEVNLARAEQCSFVALSPDAAAPQRLAARAWRAHLDVPADQPREYFLRLTSEQVRELVAHDPESVPAPDVDVSLFVQLDEELSVSDRQAVVDRINALARRYRWRRDLGAVQAPGASVRDLHALPGVAYVEPGQSLRSPEPIGVRETSAPPPSGRSRVDVQRRRHRNGEQVLVGIIDVGGFDFAHEDFLEQAGTSTRWVAIWDQGGTVRPPPSERERADRTEADCENADHFASFDYGAEIRKSDMDVAIEAGRQRGVHATTLEPQSSMVPGSHGTHVASIAAGNRGVARNALLAGVLVSLGDELRDPSRSFYDSTRVVDAVEYLLALASKLGGERALPVSLNISLGTNGHAHDASNAMARWIDNTLATPGRCVSVAAGNAGQVAATSATDRGYLNGRIHASGTLAATDLRHELRWIVGGERVADISENEMEIWYSAQDRIEVEIRPPGEAWIGPIAPGQRLRNVPLDNGTLLSVHSETYYPANGANRISILLSPYFGPTEDGVQQIGPIESGEWRVRLTGRVVRDGRYDAWIERDDPRRVTGAPNYLWRYPSSFGDGSFTDDRMINSLACADRLLAVANVDVDRDQVHISSSRGPTRDGRFKPDVAADGTNVVAAAGFHPDRRWIAMTGTSMASPYVCGVAALMLAIDRDLTSAQISAMVRARSTPLVGHDYRWRSDAGFGMINAAACVTEAADFLAAKRSADL